MVVQQFVDSLVSRDVDAVTVICANLAGDEVVRLPAFRSDLALNTLKLIAHELKVHFQSLRVVLPDGQLLASLCGAHPQATIG